MLVKKITMLEFCFTVHFSRSAESQTELSQKISTFENCYLVQFH